jgi:hypothetical protein
MARGDSVMLGSLPIFGAWGARLHAPKPHPAQGAPKNPTGRMKAPPTFQVLRVV